MINKRTYSSLGKPLITTPIIAVIFSLLIGFVCLQFLHHHINNKNHTKSLNNLAELLASQIAPLQAYNDEQKVSTILHQLDNQENIVKAVVYDIEGNIFAQFTPSAANKNGQNPASNTFFSLSNLIQVEKEIAKKDKKFGQLIIVQQHTYSLQTIELLIIAFFAITLTCIPFGYILGRRLQKSTLQPIQNVFQQIDDYCNTDDLSLRITAKRDDELGYLVDSINNTHARFQAREQLLEKRVTDKNQQFYQTRQLSEQLFEQTITPTIIVNHKQNTISNNPPFRRVFGFSCSKLTFVELLDKIDLTHQIKQDLLNGQPTIVETECLNADKQQMQVRISSPEIHSKIYQLILIEDLSQRKQIEKALYTEKAMSQTVLDSIGDAVITTSLNNEIQYMNPAAEQLSGRTQSEVVGLPISDLIKILDDNNLLFSSNSQKPNSNQHHNEVLDCFIITLDGRNRQVEYCVAPLYGETNMTLGKVITLRDVSELRHLAQKMEHHLAHDTVTGLLNRDSFQYHIERNLSAGITRDKPLSILYFDLDKFQLINSICGNEAGNQLLKLVAGHITNTARTGDPVSRMEADKYAVLLQGCPNDRAMSIAEEIYTAINETDFLWNDKHYEIGVSVGLVTVEEQPENDINLINLCETAVINAKESGGKRIQNHQLNKETQVLKTSDTTVMSRLNDALQDYNFELMFQTISPIKQPVTGEHFEILLRMRDEDGNLVPPGLFLPTAERYNMMQKLDSWVINTTVSRLIDNKELLKNLELCSINLSAQTLHNEMFLDFVTDLFRAASIPSEKICFEITETAAVSNFTQAVKFINTLKQTGCRFALDDFGTGMSSFAYLKKLPVDILKIDGIFVKNIINDPIDLTMVKTINEIGHTMGLKTVAEFAENQPIIDILTDIGVDYAQGYGIAKPKTFHSPHHYNQTDI